MQESINTKIRLQSIDALRGFDMIWILGAEGLFAALFTATNIKFFQLGANQMLHSQWHGVTAYDLIFPLFIFLAGVSLGLGGKSLQSLPKPQRLAILYKGGKRLMLLVLLGVIYNHGWGQGLPLSFEDMRVTSVLGRIGISWFFAALMVWFVPQKYQLLLVIGLFISYSLSLSIMSIGEYGNGDFSEVSAIHAWFDKYFLIGASYQGKIIDPEGVLSTVGAIINAMCGVIVGRALSVKSPNIRTLVLLVIFGLLAVSFGYMFNTIQPINKTLWTGTFIAVSVGYSVLLLVSFFWLIDILKFRTVGKIFVVIGMNSIVVYLATSLINWQYTRDSLFGGFIALFSSQWQSVVAVVLLVVIQWLCLYWLYQRKIYIKV